MRHFCSVNGGKFKRNVKVIDVFPEEKDNKLVNKKEFDGVLYEAKIPRVIFEINGREHSSKKRTINSDRAKINLVKKKEPALMMIPNHYVKHYEYIRELINKMKGDVYQKTLFDI